MSSSHRAGHISIVTFILCLSVFLSACLFSGQASAEDSDVEGFVTRFYEQCLGRQPDAAGLSYWVDSLNSGQFTGADLAWSFIFSEEFQDSGSTNDEFLYVLYQAFFDREPDTEGYNHWMELITQGTDRASVLNGFTSAQEFLALCDGYGISSGDDDTNVEGFITRFYQHCLDRYPDTDGLNHWVKSLNAGEVSGSDLAWSFIFSEEFQNSSTTDEEYLDVLYWAFFDREPDDSGLGYWLSLMDQGMDRISVLEGFTTAQEFVTLCESYGIEPGNASSNQGDDSQSSTGSDSFFPVTVDGVDTITWRYRINGGSPVNAFYEGVNLNMTFSDMDLSVNSGDMIRNFSFSGSVSGDATGSFSAEGTENIFSSGDSALLSSQTLYMEMFISAYGDSANLEIYTDSQLNSPLEWFLSRSDLDLLPAGEYGQVGESTGTTSGYVEISAAGYSETMPFSETVMSVDTWEIVETLNNYTVNGVTYNNVVVVNRYTSIPLATYSSDGPISLTIKYWLAKGIGMIKGIGQYEILGQPLEIELVSTNLSQ